MTHVSMTNLYSIDFSGILVVLKVTTEFLLDKRGAKESIHFPGQWLISRLQANILPQKMFKNLGD